MKENAFQKFPNVKKNYFLYLMISPTIIYLLIFQIYPIFDSVRTSFTDLSFLKPGSGQFVGFKNYINFFNDSNFLPLLLNSTIWVLGSTIFQYVVAIPASLLLNQKFIGRGVWRGLMMVPWVTPVIIMGMIWKWIYDGDYGLLNYVLGTDTVWLANQSTVWPALLLTSMWKGLPYATLMFLAGLQGIPIDLYEAAYVDGCGAFSRFKYITMPMLKPVILVTALTSIVQSWTKFEVIWVLTSGGPGYTTSILPTYIYTKSFVMFDMGGGSAVSVIAMLIMMVFVMLYLKVYNKGSEGGE
ncbi:MAG: carbohydrate ABC transporter permease [Ruminiclostridium sp.]